jgi:hypothetical protein
VLFSVTADISINLGATGFDMVGLKSGAGRGLLATLNRGKVKLIGKQQKLALAA